MNVLECLSCGNIILGNFEEGENVICPQCKSEYTYEDSGLKIK
jgi:DNA-directed RNA polymerase subunit RPC12/RpoP